MAPVGRNGKTQQPTAGGQILGLPTRFAIPKPQGAALGAGEDEQPVWRETDGGHSPARIFQTHQFSPRRDVPQPDAPVDAGGGSAAAVGREGDGLDGPGVSAE